MAEDVELADSLSTAMLLVLETLTPTERAVFLLRDVFDLGYDELAEAVGKTEAAVRQIAHRARGHVAARRPRKAASQAETRSALEAFMRTLETGDLQHLVDVLAPDVVALGDGGGIKQALPRPVMGADKVGKLMGVGMAAAQEMGMTDGARPASTGGRRCSSASAARSTPSCPSASTTAWCRRSTRSGTPRSCPG